MVARVQLTEEYYDSDEDDDTSAIFYAPTYYEIDEQLVIVACLMLLEQRYRLMKSMTPQEVVDEVEYIMDSLQSELVGTAHTKAINHIQEYFFKLLDDYNIPHENYVVMDTSMVDIMDVSLTNMINQLGDELKAKGMFFVDNMSKDDFNILPNFKRAVQKLVDGIGNNLIYGKEKSKRNTYKFIYGKDKLYRWLCVNDDLTCSWCLMQQSLPPRTMDEIPLDHPHGRCSLDPIDNTYSDEYYILLARADYQKEIEAFKPTDDRRWDNQ